MHDSAVTGLTRKAATTVSSTVTAEISVSGIAKRTVRASVSTSAVVRETRSPVPARSTTESGSASTWRMKSSRSRANTCSERTNEERRANQVSIVWAITDTTSTAITRSTYAVVVPSSTASHELAEQERPDEPGQGRERVQAEHDGERAAVAAQQRRPRPGAPRAPPRSAAARSCARPPW